MSNAVEQSLQIALQEPVAAVAVAVLLGGGAVGMSIRTIVESVVIDDETDEVDGALERSADAGTDADSGGHDGGASDTKTSSTGTSADADPEELEDRLDELENEVGDLSSTVDTVRAENEQISNSVQEVEQSTGRLVALFKKATGRGSGPAAEEGAVADSPTDGDDATAGSEPAGASASTGTAGAEPRPKHCVDSDEEIIETPDTGRKAAEDAPDAGVSEEIDNDTFESPSEFGTGATADTFGTEETITTPAFASDGGTAIAGTGTGTASSQSQNVADTATVDLETERLASAAEQETTEETTPTTDVTQPEPTAVQPQSTQSGTSGKPYLDGVPDGFGAEVLTVEWLEFLVQHSGYRETARAIDYYETIGWLTQETAAELDQYLDGLEAGDRGTLSVDHHLRTLEYVEELSVGDRADGSQQ